MKHIFLYVACATLLFACQKKMDTTPEETSAGATEALSNSTASLNPNLELVFTDSLYQLTGVAISREKRLFTNYPYWKGPHRYSVVEVTGVNTSMPYPNEEWNSWKPGDDGMHKWVCVQAVYVDDANKLWVVDPASPLMKGVYKHAYKLVKIDLATNTVERIYTFNYTVDAGSYLNDVRVDTATHFAYLTNSSEGGIVTVNLTTGKTNQVLGGDASVISNPAYKLTFGGVELTTDYGQPVKFNSDGIALAPGGKFLYYKPLSDDRLFRINTKYLQNFSLDATQVSSHVQFVGRYTVTDGMIFDKKGNLYFGDMQHFRMMRITPDGNIRELFRDPRLIWPDSYSLSDDGYLYISCSQIQLQPEYNFTDTLPKTPYTIYKWKIRY